MAKRAQSNRGLPAATHAIRGGGLRPDRRHDGGINASSLQFAARDAEQDALMARPGVREHLNGMKRKHYGAWADQPIPALRGKTPRQAVQTPTGRESVEALLAQFERDEARLDPKRDPAILEGLRAELGLGG